MQGSNTKQVSAGTIPLQNKTPAPLARPEAQYGRIALLTDTQGVNFGPYLKKASTTIRENWYRLIPESAQRTKGNLAIEFAIEKDGKVSRMKLVASSGDPALDQPAWAAIAASNPFPALPAEFKGDQLALRFRFLYYPDPADLSGAP